MKLTNIKALPVDWLEEEIKYWDNKLKGVHPFSSAKIRIQIRKDALLEAKSQLKPIEGLVEKSLDHGWEYEYDPTSLYFKDYKQQFMEGEDFSL